MLFFAVIVCVIGYIVAVLLAKSVISLLFPQWLEAVMDIIPLTMATIMLSILASTLNLFIFKILQNAMADCY